LKQEIQKLKLKISTLAFEVTKAKTQIDELGGGIKLATLENEKGRLQKNDDKNAQNLAVFAAEKVVVLQANKAVTEENTTMKKQLLALLPETIRFGSLRGFALDCCRGGQVELLRLRSRETLHQVHERGHAQRCLDQSIQLRY
jgi:hypothetical protein